MDTRQISAPISRFEWILPTGIGFVVTLWFSAIPNLIEKNNFEAIDAQNNEMLSTIFNSIALGLSILTLVLWKFFSLKMNKNYSENPIPVNRGKVRFARILLVPVACSVGSIGSISSLLLASPAFQLYNLFPIAFSLLLLPKRLNRIMTVSTQDIAHQSEPVLGLNKKRLTKALHGYVENQISLGKNYNEIINDLDNNDKFSSLGKDALLKVVYWHAPLDLRKKYAAQTLFLTGMLFAGAGIKLWDGIQAFRQNNMPVWSYPITLLMPLILLTLAYHVKKYRRLAYIFVFILAAQGLSSLKSNNFSALTLLILGAGILSIFLFKKLFPKLSWLSEPKID